MSDRAPTYWGPEKPAWDNLVVAVEMKVRAMERMHAGYPKGGKVSDLVYYGKDICAFYRHRGFLTAKQIAFLRELNDTDEDGMLRRETR